MSNSVCILNVVLVYACILLGWTDARDRTDCYAHDRDPYLLFGTKTAYEFVYEKPKPRYDTVPNCEPVQVWLLARHGTRFPSKKTIRNLHTLEELRQQIMNNHEQRQEGRLCYLDLDNLKTWRFNVSMADSNMLSRQGKQDLFFLGKRLRTKFPTLFTQGYSQNLYVFRHTDSERTRQSAQLFAEGIFGKDAGVWIPPPILNDTIIKPYENCSRWMYEVDDNPHNHREEELFKVSEEMNAVVRNVSRRLGFLYDLSQDTIEKIYDMCRYDKAWDVNGRSPWCAAFTKAELQVFEYLDDLEAYYEGGYGHEMNMRLGCAPLKDLLERFTLLEDENLPRLYQPYGVFYFSHSKMLTMLLSRLGLYRDRYPLRHDNYRLHHRRHWKTSYISPFAGNLAAVFYKCSSGDANRVMFYLQEKPIDFEGCEVGLCSWSWIKSRFSDVVTHCDLGWCGAASSLRTYSIVALSVITYGIYLLK